MIETETSLYNSIIEYQNVINVVRCITCISFTGLYISFIQNTVRVNSCVISWFTAVK